MGIRTLKLTKKQVWDRVEEFREKYIRNVDIPVNVEAILQTLGIEPIPIRDFQVGNIEGLISHDLKNIYIDEAQYMSENGYKSARFTFAHELGHLILHEEIIKTIKFKSEEEWANFRLNMDETNLAWFEWQANEFAGRLLVPRDRLIELFTSARTHVFGGASRIEVSEIFSVTAPMIAPKFNVSTQVIEIRLEKEELWKLF